MSAPHVSRSIEGLKWPSAVEGSPLPPLLPAIVQDAETQQVLMLGLMDREALRCTIATARVTFYSRSKGRLWIKGETSGNHLDLVSLEVDCDADALLIGARPAGPTCHRGTPSCFGEGDAPGIGFLEALRRTIEERRQALPADSYTAELFRAGIDRMAQKVGEEAVETVIASKNGDRDRLIDESADLLFHLLVLLSAREIPIGEVVERLRHRR